MGKHRKGAGGTVQELEQSYRDARLLRHRLQRLIEHAEGADEGWLELVASVEDVEYRLRCVLGSFEHVFQRAPGPSSSKAEMSVLAPLRDV